MRYFIDTEFMEDGRTIDLLSIGIVCEDGRTFYRENASADRGKANPWVQANVLPHLQGDEGLDRITSRAIREELGEFCDPQRYGFPEFWGYYCDYDWVALCQLFGTMMELPSGWPMYCRDLRQWLDERGLVTVVQPDDAPHHALSDATWIAETYLRLA